MSLLATLVASDVGDPDTWPEAVTWVGLGLCALGAYFVWTRWGGGAREREREERQRGERGDGP